MFLINEGIFEQCNDIRCLKDAWILMKFKRLPINELQKLEKEFVQFLSSNTVTADDWVKIKKENPEKADELIDMFSDVVYQKVMEKIEFLEFRTALDMKQFKCEKDQIVMMGLNITEATGLDLRKGDDLNQLERVASEVSVYKAEKVYKPSREEEIFTMMNAGAAKTEGELYRLIENLYQRVKGDKAS